MAAVAAVAAGVAPPPPPPLFPPLAPPTPPTLAESLCRVFVTMLSALKYNLKGSVNDYEDNLGKDNAYLELIMCQRCLFTSKWLNNKISQQKVVSVEESCMRAYRMCKMKMICKMRLHHNHDGNGIGGSKVFGRSTYTEETLVPTSALENKRQMRPCGAAAVDGVGGLRRPHRQSEDRALAVPMGAAVAGAAGVAEEGAAAAEEEAEVDVEMTASGMEQWLYVKYRTKQK